MVEIPNLLIKMLYCLSFFTNIFSSYSYLYWNFSELQVVLRVCSVGCSVLQSTSIFNLILLLLLLLLLLMARIFGFTLPLLLLPIRCWIYILIVVFLYWVNYTGIGVLSSWWNFENKKHGYLIELDSLYWDHR